MSDVAVAISKERPLPLRRELPPPEPYPINELGGVLAPAANRIRHIVQAPDAICGQSILAAATLAVQGHANVIIDGRSRPVSEYYLSVAETGERKSAADEYALSPIKKRQRQLSEDYGLDIESYQNDYDAWKKARDEALGKKQAGRDTKRIALQALGPAPVPPLLPMLLCEEPTYEGLVKLLAVGQPSLGLFSDEGGRMIGGHGMNKDNELKTAAGLSNLWDGREISRVRAGDGSVLLYGRRISMHLMMQPMVAQMLLCNGLLLEQGLLSRCLTASPASTAGTRSYREVDLSHDGDMKRYGARLLSLLETPLPLVEGKQNELKPRSLSLAPDAKRVWIGFHDHTEQQLANDGPLALIRGFANKAPEHALRLAGVLALVEDVNCSAIRVEHVRSGVKLIEHYLSEALRLFNAGATDPDLELAEELLRWAQPREYVYLQKIYQFGPNKIRDTKTAQRIVDILEDHGWFQRVPGGRELDGAYRKEVWRVIR
ncbi:MAG: YfjI family protein, partial [Candidatus Tectomicrobia bacterium]